MACHPDAEHEGKARRAIEPALPGLRFSYRNRNLDTHRPFTILIRPTQPKPGAPRPI
jgi:hypothetical protein